MNARLRTERRPASPLLAALIASLLFSTFFAPSARSASTLLGVRIGVTSERTRVVLDLASSSYSFRQSLLGDSVVVVSLSGVKSAAQLDLPRPDGLVLRATLVPESGKGKGTPAGLSLRLRLRVPSKVRVFRVVKDGGHPHRLVLDLTPKAVERPALPDVAVAKPAKTAPEAPTKETSKGLPKETSKTVSKEPPSTTLHDPANEPNTTAPEPAKSDPEPGNAAPADPSPSPQRRGPRIVVVDAGHGGNDPGASAKGLREKDVCLDVARRLVARLNEGSPAKSAVKGVLTRDDDRLVPLRDRRRFAEKQDADLMLSIHVNAAQSRSAHGIEVFFLSMGASSDEASRELARLENEVDPDYVVEEDGSLKGLPFAVNLRQSDTMLRSSRAAESLLDFLVDRKLAENRGVKQAGFAVLKSYQVPSILVELGFISSASDRDKLKDPAHRQKLADSLADGVRRYFELYAPQRPGPETP